MADRNQIIKGVLVESRGRTTLALLNKAVDIALQAAYEDAARIADNMPRVTTNNAPPDDRPAYAHEAAEAIRSRAKEITNAQ